MSVPRRYFNAVQSESFAVAYQSDASMVGNCMTPTGQCGRPASITQVSKHENCEQGSSHDFAWYLRTLLSKPSWAMLLCACRWYQHLQAQAKPASWSWHGCIY